MDRDLGRAFNCRDFFFGLPSLLYVVFGFKANRLMDKDLGRAFNCRDFFFGLPSMRYVIFGGEGQTADGQGPGQGFQL